MSRANLVRCPRCKCSTNSKFNFATVDGRNSSRFIQFCPLCGVKLEVIKKGYGQVIGAKVVDE